MIYFVVNDKILTTVGIYKGILLQVLYWNLQNSRGRAIGLVVPISDLYMVKVIYVHAKLFLIDPVVFALREH